MKTIAGNPHLLGDATVRFVVQLDLGLAPGGTYEISDAPYPGSNLPRPKLLSVDQIQYSTLAFGVDSFSMVVENTDSIDGVQFSTLWDAANPIINAAVRAYYNFGSGSPSVQIFDGVVGEVLDITPRSVGLRLVGRNTILDKEVGVIVDRVTYPGAPDASIGKIRPIVLGSIVDYVPLMVDENKSTRLRFALLKGGTSITVESASGFPSGGQLLIDDEVISYASLGGNVFSGLTRPAPQSHAPGTEVLEYGTEVWLVAAHPVAAITNVRAVNSRGQIVALDDPSIVQVFPAAGTVQITGKPRVVVAGGVKYADVDADAAGALNTAGNPQNAAGRSAQFDEYNFATLAQGQVCSVRRTGSITPPGGGEIRRVLVAVEHFGVASLQAPSSVQVYTNGQSAGALTAVSAVPEEQQQEIQPYSLSKGFQDTHGHNLTGGLALVSDTYNVSFFGGDVDGNNWLNKTNGYDGSGATLSEYVPLTAGDRIFNMRIHGSTPDLNQMRQRVKRVSLSILHGTIQRTSGQESGSFTARINIGAFQLSVGFGGSNGTDIAVDASESGDILAQGLTLADFYAGGAAGTSPAIVTISGTVTSTTTIFGLRDVRVNFELVDPTDPVQIEIINQKPQGTPSFFWTDGDSSVQLATNATFNWTELTNDTAAVIREIYCSVDVANILASSYGSTMTTGFRLLINSVAVATGSVVIAGRDFHAAAVRLIPPVGFTVSTLIGGTVGIQLFSTSGGQGTEVDFAFVVEPVAASGTSIESPMEKSSINIFEAPGLALGSPADWNAVLQSIELECRATNFQAAETVSILRAWWLVEYDSIVKEAAASIVCDVTGLASSGNPADMIEAVYTDPSLPLGYLSADVIDATYQAAARAALVTAGLTGGGVISDQMTSADVLEEIASQFRLRYWWENGKLRLYFQELIAGLPAAVRNFDVEFQKQDALSITPRPASSVVNKACFRYKPNYVERDFDEVLEDEDATSIARFGREYLEQRDLSFVWDVAVAQSLADMLFDRFGAPADVVEFVTFLTGLDIERGDIVAFDHGSFAAGSKCEVQSIRYKVGTAMAIDEITFEVVKRL